MMLAAWILLNVAVIIQAITIGRLRRELEETAAALAEVAKADPLAERMDLAAALGRTWLTREGKGNR